MIKIFTLDKTIYLTDEKIILKPDNNSILIGIDTEDDIQKAYTEFSTNHTLHSIYLSNTNIDWLFLTFKKMFRIIEAAGGLVSNNNGEYLFIFRNGKWDLPKGKIEKGETIELAAIREVEEECGINGITIERQLRTTYHIYSLEEKNILKPTYWFFMTTNSNKKLTPQTEEGITDVRWFKKEELSIIQKNTYASITDVISQIL